MDHVTENAGVEPEGIAATSVLAMVLAIVAALAVVVVGGVQIALSEFDSAEVTAIETTGYPVLKETNAAAQALLNGSGVVDAANGIYRIPIDRAMQDLVMASGNTGTGELTLSR
jgi:hypothetical protein